MTIEDFQHQVRSIKQALQRGQSATAHQHIQDLLSASLNEQQQSEVFYLKAVTCRISKQYDDAFKVINTLLSLRPDYGRGYQELAYCHEALGDKRNAADAFFKATHFNPALISSWKKLLVIWELTI